MEIPTDRSSTLAEPNLSALQPQPDQQQQPIRRPLPPRQSSNKPNSSTPAASSSQTPKSNSPPIAQSPKSLPARTSSVPLLAASPKLPPRKPPPKLVRPLPHQRLCLIIRHDNPLEPFAFLPMPGTMPFSYGLVEVSQGLFLENVPLLREDNVEGLKIRIVGDSAAALSSSSDSIKVEAIRRPIKELEIEVKSSLDRKDCYEVFGVLGVIHLPSLGPRLLVLVRRRYLGKLVGHGVFRVEKVAVLPFNADEASQIMDKLSQPVPATTLDEMANPFALPVLDSNETTNTLDFASLAAAAATASLIPTSTHPQPQPIPARNYYSSSSPDRSPGRNNGYDTDNSDTSSSSSGMSPARAQAAAASIAYRRSMSPLTSTLAQISAFFGIGTATPYGTLVVAPAPTYEGYIPAPVDDSASESGGPSGLRHGRQRFPSGTSADEDEVAEDTPALLRPTARPLRRDMSLSPERKLKNKEVAGFGGWESSGESRSPSPFTSLSMKFTSALGLTAAPQTTDESSSAARRGSAPIVSNSAPDLSARRVSAQLPIMSQTPRLNSNSSSRDTKQQPRSKSPAGILMDSINPFHTEITDSGLLKEIVSLFASCTFFISYEDDLTRSMQWRAERKEELKEWRDRVVKSRKERGDPEADAVPEGDNEPLWKTADPRFFWNETASRILVDVGAHRFVLPVMQGFVQVQVNCQIEDDPFVFAVVSRRSKARAGVRYERRGVDGGGEVANFVETEMVVVANVNGSEHIASFVQVRGSIPLYWKQIPQPNVLNPPPILLESDETNENALRLHFTKLLQLYHHQVLVIDLLALHGRESTLGSKYRNMVARTIQKLPESESLEYREYDFHHETRGLKYEKVAELVNMLETEFGRIQHFWSTNGETMCKQKGVIRTNCMDCLDRTNVVQSVFGRFMLNMILFRMSIQGRPEEGIETHTHFESIFKEVWANNGDYISTAYAGTAALKGDFTRTGNRNIKGMFNDASNSLTRLYADNFTNKLRQASIDLLLGITENGESPGIAAFDLTNNERPSESLVAPSPPPPTNFTSYISFPEPASLTTTTTTSEGVTEPPRLPPPPK